MSSIVIWKKGFTNSSKLFSDLHPTQKINKCINKWLMKINSEDEPTVAQKKT